MEKDKSFTGPVFEKEEKRAVGRQFPLEANERRWGEGCPRSRDLRLVGEKRKHEQPVAVQCRVICLYSAVSGCATCWKPPYSTPDYTFAEIRTKYYVATWIRYRRTNLSLWQKRGISITLSLSLALLLSCPFFFRALRAEAVRYTQVGMKRSWPLAQDFVAIRKFLVGKQGCKYA